MSTEQSTKNAGMMLLHIGLRAGDDLLRALEMTLNTIRYANYEYGEDHYKDYLAKKGLEFKTEEGFVRVATKMRSDIERIPVSQAQIKDLKQLAKQHGCDFFLCKRPENLDELVDKKYIHFQPLTPPEEKLLDAFLIHGEDGRVLLDPKNAQRPLLNDREYMFTIRSTDWNSWDLILKKMQTKYQKPTLEERLKRAKIQLNLDRLKQEKEAKGQSIQLNGKGVDRKK